MIEPGRFLWFQKPFFLDLRVSRVSLSKLGVRLPDFDFILAQQAIKNFGSARILLRFVAGMFFLVFSISKLNSVLSYLPESKFLDTDEIELSPFPSVELWKLLTKVLRTLRHPDTSVLRVIPQFILLRNISYLGSSLLLLIAAGLIDQLLIIHTTYCIIQLICNIITSGTSEPPGKL